MSSAAAPVPERSAADTRRAFAARVRAPRSAPLPDGVDARRMQVYEELCYSNVEGLLAGAFPVMRSVLGDAEWNALVRSFFADHRATSPLFTEVAAELAGGPTPAVLAAGRAVLEDLRERDVVLGTRP